MTEVIVRIAARGDGVTASGRFVAGTAPGDSVGSEGCITPGSHRATPPCRHFGVCGGCQLQHIDDESYARFIVDRIRTALAEQGIVPPDIAPPHLSPPRTRRRATLRAERRGRQVSLGFNEGASHRIVDLRECHVLLPELFALVAPLRGLLAEVVPDRGRATLTLARVDQGIDLTIAGVELDDFAALDALNAFAAARSLARVSIDEGDGASPRWAPVPPTVTLGGVAVGFPEGAFLQATADGETALVTAVRDAVAQAGRVVDLFAGLGTFALSLAGQVAAVEGNRDAALALRATGRVAVEHRDLFRRPLAIGEFDCFDAVVLDPPRAGAREQMPALAASKVPRIAYVSCNPATFARDARVLIDGGYALTHIAPVGQFRWSTHVELAAAFIR